MPPSGGGQQLEPLRTASHPKFIVFNGLGEFLVLRACLSMGSNHLIYGLERALENSVITDIYKYISVLNFWPKIFTSLSRLILKDFNLSWVNMIGYKYISVPYDSLDHREPIGFYEIHFCWMDLKWWHFKIFCFVTNKHIWHRFLALFINLFDFHLFLSCRMFYKVSMDT